jgi:hypothetical protein
MLPCVTRASVHISEIAWMGSPDNANAEWMELWNDGSETLDLSGWTLVATDGQPSIDLTGSIGPNAYFLLERTSDDTVPGVPADQIYTGALGNAGEVLELHDASGAVMDTVDGSENWALGGDNDRKLTMQRTNGGWVTAEPTPRRSNAQSDDTNFLAAQEVAADTAAAEQNDSGGTDVAVAAPSKKAVAVAQPLTPALTLEIGRDRTVPAGVPLTLSATTRREGGVALNLNDVRWNFGDGATAAGAAVKHTYAYPGDYVVVAHATRPQVRPSLVADDRLVVHVVPLELHVSAADVLSLEVTNESVDEIDLSQFALTAGKDVFRVPSGTVLLPKATVRFPATITKLVVTDPYQVGIFTPGGKLVAQGGMSPEPAAVDAPVVLADEEDVPIVDDSLAMLDPTPPDAPEPVADEPAPVAAVVDDPPAGNVAAAFAGIEHTETGSTFWWWVLGCAAIVLTAIAAVVLMRRERAEIIAGFEIESDE